MASFTGIHCPDIAFIPRGGGGGRREGNATVSRFFFNSNSSFNSSLRLVLLSQLCLPRKLIFCRAKLESVLDGSLHEEHGISLVDDVIENFPHFPNTGRPIVPVPPLSSKRDAKKLRSLLRVTVPDPSGNVPPHIIYLLEMGFDHEQIKAIVLKCPPFAYYSLEGKIKPLVEFLLDLGVSQSDLPRILGKCTVLCGISLPNNIIPTMALLETLGLDKKKWGKVITRYPGMLSFSHKKMEAIVKFLSEEGLSKESIGKILTRCPQIVGHSVEHKLRPSAEYFKSLGVDAAVVLRCCPQIMNLSIEDNLKPFTEFFLENGFSMEEVGIMISKFGTLYSYSLKDNVVPKWEFFLTMDYSRHDLINFPQYFGYSLKGRIKPRYEVVKESGVEFLLSKLLYLKDNDFEWLLKKKVRQITVLNSETLSSNGEVSPLDAVWSN